MLVHIATSRPVGQWCIEWAIGQQKSKDWALTNKMDDCDVFISVMYDTLVDERFINGKPGRRCYNFHPGILPQYRGSGAFSWAIINGEKFTGITLHELDVDIDHGPIIAQWKIPVESESTAESLFKNAMFQMEKMFQAFFLNLLRKNWTNWNGVNGVGVQQDESKAKVYYRRDLERVRDLTRFVRAFEFEGKEPAYYIDRNGKKVEVRW